MDSFRIAEEKIKKAMEEGLFDNLPGAGKPLPEDEFASLPPELRMAYRMMKNAGFTPEDASLRREMRSLEQLVHDCIDPEEKRELKRQLDEKMLRYNQMLSKRKINTNSSIFKNYEQKIEKKLFEK
ncbi:DnaJ family domain-containing protein [Domibacillus indicus]|uniref:DnaJ family domain-containing protein n=1 Tax=Domibacillus indicus TaxID=1437523 RepID=UPI00061817CB|nr:DUF1992 domain-containing protein [Domibacillus indicus]